MDCDFLFGRADGSFCIEEADGCAPHQPGSLLVDVSLNGVYDWYKYRPDQITRAMIDGGKEAAAAAMKQTKAAQPRPKKVARQHAMVVT